MWDKKKTIEYSEEEIVNYLRGKWAQANAMSCSITKEGKYELCLRFKKPVGIRKWFPTKPFPVLLKEKALA